MPSATISAAFWDRIARKYAASPIKDMASYEHTLTRTAAYLSNSDRVLEIGCGTGTTALKLAPFAGSILATDFAPGMIAIAREKGAGTDNVRFETVSAGAPPQGPFDAILGFNLFHLVPDLPQVLAGLRDQLAPGGLLISKSACLRDANPLIRLLIPAMQLVGKAPYVNVLSVAGLERMITDAGFEIVETGTFPKKPPARFIVARKR